MTSKGDDLLRSKLPLGDTILWGGKLLCEHSHWWLTVEWVDTLQFVNDRTHYTLHGMVSMVLCCIYM